MNGFDPKRGGKAMLYRWMLATLLLVSLAHPGCDREAEPEPAPDATAESAPTPESEPDTPTKSEADGSEEELPPISLRTDPEPIEIAVSEWPPPPLSQAVQDAMAKAQSHLDAGRPRDAADIMIPLETEYPSNFDISMLTGKALLGIYKDTKAVADYNAAQRQFAKPIVFFNRQIDKPAHYWDAWLGLLKLMEAEGGEKQAAIPGRARILLNVDKNLGGPEFKEQFEKLFEDNGGVERVE